MQNPRVSLPSVGSREVRHGNTRPTTRTARFFSYTHYAKLNWPRKADRLWPLRPAVSCTRKDADWPKGCNRWTPTANQWFFWLYLNARHAVNKRRTSPGSWSQELSSDTKINEIRQRRPKWRQFKKVVSLAGLHHIRASRYGIFAWTQQPTHEFNCRTSSGCGCMWGTSVGGHAKTRYRVEHGLRLPMRKKMNIEELELYSRSQQAPS